MTATDLNILVVLSERARAAGLIQFSEFTAVFSAVENAKKEILEAQKKEVTEGDTNAKAAK